MSENNVTPVQENTPVQNPQPVEQARSEVVTDETAVATPKEDKAPLIPENKKFCHKCGTEVNHTTRFCRNCGADVNAPVGATPPPMVNGEEQDAKDNKVMAVLSYCGILCLVPVFAAKESPFARFHANQGVILFLANIALSILKSVNGNLIYSISSVLYHILNFGFGAVGIGVWVLAIIGIISAFKGEKKKLPLVGDLNILKK